MNINENEIIKIAKRDNNKKRTFLLVNPIQGKHIPVSPAAAFALFQELAENIFSENEFNNNTIIIGFSETATAIGAALAAYPDYDIPYITTTRESIPDTEYLYFSEEHSHASEQKLYKEFLDTHIKDHTHIIFAEDEVTTGKTIENIIRVIKSAYPAYQLAFTIASLLNGMPEEKIHELEDEDIHCCFLLKVPAYDYETHLSSFGYDDSLKNALKNNTSAKFDSFQTGCYKDVRQGLSMKTYQHLCDDLSSLLTSKFNLTHIHQKKILILGTEEFMYPGLYWGRYLEENTDHKIFFHATTRSPILPSKEDSYPIKERFQLKSFYEEDRTTYLYNLDHYDYVYILTDAPEEPYAMPYLCNALNKYHCDMITKIIWRED